MFKTMTANRIDLLSCGWIMLPLASHSLGPGYSMIQESEDTFIELGRGQVNSRCPSFGSHIYLCAPTLLSCIRVQNIPFGNMLFPFQNVEPQG